MLFEIGIANGRYRDPKSLTRFDAQVYSQNGEDGLIAEIFRRVGKRDIYFVEIGVENGQQTNTRLLLEQGWRGIWIDSNADSLRQATETFAAFINNGALRIVSAAVTPANVNALLSSAGGSEDVRG
jgi:hypothetical protein